jgi:hypothetical protein
MTETLESKILKHLAKNDNGNYIDVLFLSENKKLLLDKIRELNKLGYLTMEYLTRINSSIPLPTPKCKIQLAGKKFLSEIELKSNNVTNHFNNSNIGQFNQDSVFFESPNNIKTKDAPSNNPEIKSSLQKFFSNSWVLLISGIAIEEITLGKIYKFIISLI